MILIIDNYDSFTYNLYQLMGELHEDIIVKRNDEISIQDIKKLNPEVIVISPGPGNPENKRDFGICTNVIQKFGNLTPILGVCLGHQGIFNAFGGEIIRTEPVHGKTSQIIHTGDNIFKGVKNPLSAARYHSLLCNSKTTPECIEVIARTSEGKIMAITHNDYPIVGLQFHPESVGTPDGIKILKNFLEM
jgi:anthranilate synthase component 2